MGATTLAGLLGLVAAPAGWAASFTWDGNGSVAPNPQDGAGNWLSAGRWWSGSASTNWDNLAGNDAIFGFGTGGSGQYNVSFSSEVTVGTLTFANQKYTIIGTVTTPLNILNGIVANANAQLDTPVYIASDNVWTIAAGKTLTLTGTLSGAGPVTVTKSGAGNVVFSGLGAAGVGTMRLEAGTVTIDSFSPLAYTTMDTMTGGGALSFTGNGGAFGQLTGSGNINLVSTASQAVSLGVGYNNSSQSYAGVLSGTGSLTKTGTGTLTLTGANTFGGETRIGSGTLALGNSLALQNSTLNMDSSDAGTLSFGTLTAATVAQIAGSRGIKLENESGAAVTLTAGGNNSTVIFTGALSGIGNLMKVGTGKLTLSKTFSTENTFSGSTRIGAGTLTLATSEALQFSTLDMNASDEGLLTLSGISSAKLGNLTGSRALSIASNTFSIGGNNTSQTYSGVLSGGGGSLTKTGTGSLTLAAANTFTGNTRISAGELILAHSLALQSSLLNLNSDDTGTLSFGTLTAATLGNLFGARGLTLENAGGNPVALTAGQEGSSLTYSGALAGAGSLTKVGSGTMTLTGGNSYTGGTTISGGTVSITAGNQLGASVGPLTWNGGTLTISGVAVNDLNGRALSTTAPGGILNIFSAANVVTLNQAITGSGSLTKAGAGRLVFTTANSYTGGTTISGGYVVATHPSAFNPATGGAVTIGTGAGLLYLAATDAPLALPSTLTINGGSSGARLGGTLGSTGASAAITVAGAATATGTIYLSLNRLGAFSPGSFTILQGGAGSSLNGASYLVTNPTDYTTTILADPTSVQVTVAAATPLTTAYWKGGLSGATSVWAMSNGATASNWAATEGGPAQPLVPGAGTDVVYTAVGTTLSPASTTLGSDMSIRGLTIRDNLQLVSDGSNRLTIGAGGITMEESSRQGAIAVGIVLTADQTWTNRSFSDVAITGAVSGTANIIKNGIGTVSLGVGSTFVGTVTVNEGVYSILTDSALGDAANGVILNPGGTLRFGLGITLQPARVITINGTASLPSGLHVISTQSIGAGQLAGAGVAQLSSIGQLSIDGANPGFTGDFIVGAPGQLVGNVFSGRVYGDDDPTLLLQNGGSLPNLKSLTMNNSALLAITQTPTAQTGRIGPATTLTFNSAKFQYTTSANGGAPINETFGNVNARGLFSIYPAGTPGPAGGTTLNFGSLNRVDRATLFVRAATVGGPVSATSERIFFSSLTPDTTTSGTTRSVLPWAAGTVSTYAPDGFMTYDANGLRPLSSSETVTVAANGLAAAGAGTNVIVGGSQVIASGGQVVNSLAMTSSATIIITGTATPGTTGDVLTITSGALAAQNGVTLTNATVNLPNGGYFFAGGFTIQVTGTSRITGANGLVVSAIGTDVGVAFTNTATGGNTFTGGLFINGNAVVTFTRNDHLGYDGLGQGAGDITLGGGSLIYSLTGGGNLALSQGVANRAIKVNAAGGTIGNNTTTGTLQIPGTISGEGQMQFAGSGVVELTNFGANTYTGGTLISRGTLRLSNVNQLGSGSILLNGGTLQPSANLTFSRAMTLVADSTIDTLTRDFTLTAGINGASGLAKAGSGRLIVASALTYTGTTTITAGTLVETAAGSLSDGSAVTINGATAVLDLGANHNDTVGTVTLQNGGLISGTGTSTLTVNGSQTFALQSGTVNAALAGAAALNKTTTGIVTLAGANRYTGATTVTAGTLVVSGSISGSSVLVGISGTMNVTGTVTTPANVVVTGILSGGSTDGLTGRIEGSGGRIFVNTAGGISPGTSGNGLTSTAILKVNALSSNTGAHLDIQLGGTTAGTLYDKVVVDNDTATAIDLNAINSGAGTTLNLTLTAYTYHFGDKFFIIENVNAAGSVHGLFSNPVAPLLGFDTITAGGVTFAIGYSGDAGSNSFTGGNDVVLMAVPEPEPSALLASAFAGLLGWRRSRRKDGAKE